MLNYVIRRVLYAIPILLGVSLITFMLFYGTVPPEQMARQNLSAKNSDRSSKLTVGCANMVTTSR